MPVSLVLGASGAVGRFLLPRLRAASHAVHALSRHNHADSVGLHWLTGDLYAAMPELPRLDAIFSLGPLDGLARWLRGAEFDGSPRLIALGSMSVVSKRDSSDVAERAMAERLAQAERTVMQSAARRGMNWTLLRPTMIYGAGLDRSLTPLARFGMRWRVFPRLPCAAGLRQPVHADDLAIACLAAFDSPNASGRTYALGGGERLAFGVMLERIRASLPATTLPLRLPRAALRTIARTARFFPRQRLSLASLARLDIDLIADDGAARVDLGWAPRAFRPDARCWIPPSLS
ncbi:MAG: NAD(P)H-binding protein [Rhodanobacteraceae bacterium]